VTNPPGSRTRARNPSAASASRSAPGQRSAATLLAGLVFGLVEGTAGFYASASKSG
jgi:hypothetical protein